MTMKRLEDTGLEMKFIRGAVFSADEQVIYLIEANHKVYALTAEPHGKARISSILGSENFAQSQALSVNLSPPVKIVNTGNREEMPHCLRRANIYMQKGVVEVMLLSDDPGDAMSLNLGVAAHTGYPPEDAVKLEDFSSGK